MNGQVRIAPRSEAMSGGHGDLTIPPRDGEGDHAQHGEGGPELKAGNHRPPSTTPLRVAVPLPVPGRI